MTEKMKSTADKLGTFICRNYDEVLIDTMFGGGLVIEDVIFQILVECCRYAYLYNAEKHPWKFFTEQDGLETDSARQRLKRTLTYVENKFDIEQKMMKESLDLDAPRPEHDLQFKKGRYPFYNISKFQYWEMNNINDMGIVKAILERRIPSSKSISVDRFIELADDYDKVIKHYMNMAEESSEDMVFSSLVLFTLQTKYSFDYYYKLACEMEKQHVKTIPDMRDRLMATSGSFKCRSVLEKTNPNLLNDNDCYLQYPMIIQRERLIPHMVGNPKGPIIDAAIGMLIEANVLANSVQSHCQFIKGQSMRTWFRENTNIEDWASVFRIYNVFRTFEPNKEWTDSRIKAVRKCYDLCSIDYRKKEAEYNPENRT